jgi:hypothetical protein
VPLLSLKGGRKGSWWEFWLLLLLLLLQRGKQSQRDDLIRFPHLLLLLRSVRHCASFQICEREKNRNSNCGMTDLQMMSHFFGR